MPGAAQQLGSNGRLAYMYLRFVAPSSGQSFPILPLSIVTSTATLDHTRLWRALAASEDTAADMHAVGPPSYEMLFLHTCGIFWYVSRQLKCRHPEVLSVRMVRGGGLLAVAPQPRKVPRGPAYEMSGESVNSTQSLSG